MGPGRRKGYPGQGGPWECPSWDSPQALSRKASERCLIKNVKMLASRAEWGGGESAAISVPLLSLPDGEQCDGIRYLSAHLQKHFLRTAYVPLNMIQGNTWWLCSGKLLPISLI